MKDLKYALLQYESWLTVQVRNRGGEVSDAFHEAREQLRLEFRTAREEANYALSELEKAARELTRYGSEDKSDSLNAYAFESFDRARARVQKAIDRITKEAMAPKEEPF